MGVGPPGGALMSDPVPLSNKPLVDPGVAREEADGGPRARGGRCSGTLETPEGK